MLLGILLGLLVINYFKTDYSQKSFNSSLHYNFTIVSTFYTSSKRIQNQYVDTSL